MTYFDVTKDLWCFESFQISHTICNLHSNSASLLTLNKNYTWVAYANHDLQWCETKLALSTLSQHVEFWIKWQKQWHEWSIKIQTVFIRLHAYRTSSEKRLRPLHMCERSVSIQTPGRNSSNVSAKPPPPLCCMWEENWMSKKDESMTFSAGSVTR